MESLIKEPSKIEIISKWYKSGKRKLLSNARINYRTYAIILLGLLSSLYITYSIVHYAFVKNHFDPIFGTMGKSCPACFGNKACPYFFMGEVNIKGIYRLPFLHHYKSRQIYESYYGLYNRKTNVIIKKLATHKELEDTDLRICDSNRYRDLHGKCIPRHAIWKYLDYHPLKVMQLAHVAQTRNTAPMTYCVTERLIQRIKVKYRERDSKNTELPFSRREQILILYTLNLNQQPLVLQLFPAEEGWPFPKYLGACGRWVVEEHCGRPMDDFCHVKFWQKLRILINLLSLPAKLDQSDIKGEEWVLYIGDPDPENFMVNPTTFEVKIVDVEHMLVVDVKHIRQMQLENYNEPHRVRSDPCETGLAPNYFNCTQFIDHSTLCVRQKSDHNIHTICALLLSETDASRAPACLLNDDRLVNFRQLLHQCVYDQNARQQHLNSMLDQLKQLAVSSKKEDL